MHGDALRHAVVDGATSNLFLRQGEVAVHALCSDGADPRLLFAFPAGNSGAALWFEPSGTPVHWQVEDPLQSLEARDAAGRRLRGASLGLRADVPRLVLRAALVGSIRTLRDFQALGTAPEGVAPPLQCQGAAAWWARDRLDGAAGYRLELEMLEGTLTQEAGRLVLQAAPGGSLRLRVAACTGEPPLQPLPLAELLAEPPAVPDGAVRSLAFLAYADRLLAGSWRFLTYFGRDTLMSLRLLMPALAPAAIEMAIGSVLERLGPDGEVAHEEDIGEFAVLRHRDLGRGACSEPIYDYKMVDDDFMLAPVAAHYLLQTPAGRSRAAAFLQRRRADGMSYGALLALNLRLVLARTEAFALAPCVEHLIRLKPGEVVGDWRDSADGLGGGVVPYSVNAALVPAALQRAADLLSSGLLPALPGLPGPPQAQRAAAASFVWQQHAPRLFNVQRSLADVRADIRREAAARGLDADAALASLPAEGLLHFSALALDAAGRAVPVLHSDFGFALLFLQPDAATLQRELTALMRPYPAGLLSDVGLLVANGVFAGDALRPLFGPDRYHGAVVWSWQQALMAAGLERQLARDDLTAAVRAQLADARRLLWRAILAGRALASAELWSWAVEHGRPVVRPFGPVAATADESNAAQLWSTVFVALQPPEAEGA